MGETTAVLNVSNAWKYAVSDHIIVYSEFELRFKQIECNIMDKDDIFLKFHSLQFQMFITFK